MNSKSLDLEKGQHLLADKKTLMKEIQISDIAKEDKVLEIGAGTGILTRELVKKSKKVLAFEIDDKFKQDLSELEKEYPNLKVIYDNALKYDWTGYSKIVSNIPYSLSEQLINKALREEIPHIILIIGENFKNILEGKETKAGIIANLFYNIEFIMKVNKKNFFPPPRIDSWLIKLDKKKIFSEAESIIISILKRKGKLKNAILYSLIERGKTKRESKKIIEDMKIYKQILEKPTNRITANLLIRLLEEFQKMK